MDIELGIIEGFYGKPWTWAERQETLAYLAPAGFRFYLYAPKADPYMRRRWREPHPADAADGLRGLARRCRELEVRFGVGLSPYEVYRQFDDDARAGLADKLAFFDDVGIADLAILFDDMRGDSPDLAARQSDIVHWVAERSAADRILLCPTYYSDDPVLDRVFGERPADYLEDLGSRLDPAVEIFWTGEEVVSRAYSPGHLEGVADVLGRKPFLWDNYPVNDGQRLSQYLHLRGFTGRPANMARYIAGHGINPALQPTLTRIPALTLAESYRLGEAYRYGDAFRRAALEIMGTELGTRIREDLLTLQDVGLDRLGEKADLLRERYGDSDHPGAREVIAWLDGAYRITDEIVQTQ